MKGLKKGKLVIVSFADHSLLLRGSKKDNDKVVLNVAGRIYSSRGKQLILETWWTDDESLIDNHEWAKILKADILSVRFLV